MEDRSVTLQQFDSWLKTRQGKLVDLKLTIDAETGLIYRIESPPYLVEHNEKFHKNILQHLTFKINHDIQGPVRIHYNPYKLLTKEMT